MPYPWYPDMLQLLVERPKENTQMTSLTTVQVVKPVTSPANARLLPRRSPATAVSNEFKRFDQRITTYVIQADKLDICLVSATRLVVWVVNLVAWVVEAALSATRYVNVLLICVDLSNLLDTVRSGRSHCPQLPYPGWWLRRWLRWRPRWIRWWPWRLRWSRWSGKHTLKLRNMIIKYANNFARLATHVAVLVTCPGTAPKARSATTAVRSVTSQGTAHHLLLSASATAASSLVTSSLLAPTEPYNHDRSSSHF